MSKHHGKWSDSGVPHRGWRCIDFEDLGNIDAVCEMCKIQEIRYVYYMQHSNYDDVLRVGCMCAERMEGDYVNPRKREHALKNANQRRRRWLTRKWRVSAKGNPFLNTDGFNITVYQKPDGLWAGRIEDRLTGQSKKSRRQYQTEDQAKFAAFDAMIFLKNKKGWGS